MSLDGILFYVCAAVALASALVVAGQRNPAYSAFALIVTLCSLSVLFGLLGSAFIAALQVVVYAGAIMVLFLFVLMLLNVQREERVRGRPRGALMLTAVGLALVLAGEVGFAIVQRSHSLALGFDASTRKVAEVLFSPQYLYVFEATSILILAALVGAIVLAKRDL